MNVSTLGRQTLVLVVLIMTACPAPAETGHLVFSNGASSARSIAHGLFEREAGVPIALAAVEVAKVDLDGDGEDEIFAYAHAPFFCTEMGCLPRIFRRTGDAWLNVLIDESGITRGGSNNISVIGMAKGGFTDVMLGSVVLEWDGSSYREYQPPPVTQLDNAAFLTACKGSASIGTYVADSDPVAQQPVATFCACLAGQFENASLAQGDLDIYAKKLAGALTDAAIADLVTEPQAYLYRLHDFELSCRIELTVD